MNNIARIQTETAIPPAALSSAPPPAATTPEQQDQPAAGFNKRFAGARREAGLTPGKLAKRVGLTTAEIKDIETDGRWCSLEQVRGFAAVLNADTTWLWLGKEPMARRPGISGLSAIADHLETVHEKLVAQDAAASADYDSGAAADLLASWWDVANGVPDLPVSGQADVLALARICRCTWSRTAGDDCELRDVLDQKLQRAVLAQAMAPAANPDQAVINLLARHDALHLRYNSLFNGDDALARRDYDEAVRQGEVLLDEADRILVPALDSLHVTTSAGLAAIAKSVALRGYGLVIDNDGNHPDSRLLNVMVEAGYDIVMRRSVGPAADPDAPVYEAVERVRQVYAKIDAFPADADREAEFDALVDESNPVIEQMASMPVHTLAAVQAKARCLLELHRRPCLANNSAFQSTDAETGALAMLEQLAAIPLGVSSTPDAEVIALCQHYVDVKLRWKEALRREGIGELTAAEGDALREPLEEEKYDLLEKIMEQPVTTHAGVRAVARAWRSFEDGVDGGCQLEIEADGGTSPERFAWKLVQALTTSATVLA